MYGRAIRLLYLAVFILGALVTASGQQKLKPADILDKHLASLGTPEARTAIKTRLIAGTAAVTFQVGSQGTLEGKGNIISEGRSLRWGMNFGALEYPGEQLAFDGQKVSTGRVKPGQRSTFSNFIYTYSAVLKEGLLGGVLSTAWPLLDVAGRQPKLEYAGIKKISGNQAHEIRYKAKKGMGDLEVSLFFDAETFRHLRTQYRLTVPDGMSPAPGQATSETSTHYELLEDFDDFKPVDGITLPHSCALHMTLRGQSTSFMAEWKFAVTQLLHNQEVDGKFFSVQ